MRILFYCQHVLGIGHFFRSMAIAGALDRHEILFAGGGEPLAGFAAPRHVEMLSLPPLMMDPEFSSLETGGESVEEVKEKRRRMLVRAFEGFGPDLIVTELFPFGRRRFRFELLPLLRAAKAAPRPARIVCSLRDILVEKDRPGYEREVTEILNGCYDLLLVHSDPRIAALDETFSLCGQIRVPVEYTGFVARPAPARKPPGPGKIVVASSGGGRVGADLLSAAALALRKIGRGDLELRIFAGPFLEENDRERLQKLASEDPRISFLPFSLDFLSELAQADLSISMAGYNTCMDILSAGVPALVHPFPQNREQSMRAAKLEGHGLLKVLTGLAPETLASEMEYILDQGPFPAASEINLSGAANTARLIEKLGAAH